MRIKGTFAKEHVQAVGDSVKKACHERPSMVAHEMLKCEIESLKAESHERKEGR